MDQSIGVFLEWVGHLSIGLAVLGALRVLIERLLFFLVYHHFAVPRMQSDMDMAKEVEARVPPRDHPDHELRFWQEHVRVSKQHGVHPLRGCLIIALLTGSWLFSLGLRVWLIVVLWTVLPDIASDTALGRPHMLGAAVLLMLSALWVFRHLQEQHRATDRNIGLTRDGWMVLGFVVAVNAALFFLAPAGLLIYWLVVMFLTSGLLRWQPQSAKSALAVFML